MAPHTYLDLAPGGAAAAIAVAVGSDRVLPLASDHGGVWLMPLDAVGLVVDMHVAFTPDGWGREALEAERAAVARAFADGAALLVTYEVEGWRRSQPPRSFGFKPAADFLPHPLIGKRTRTWFLTHAAWTASPAARRLEVASCPG